MTDDIITWVNKIGVAQKIPEVLKFTTNRGEIVEVGDEYEESYHEGSEGEEFFPTALPQECVDDEDPGENMDPPTLTNPVVPVMFEEDRSAETEEIGDEDAGSSSSSN